VAAQINLPLCLLLHHSYGPAKAFSVTGCIPGKRWAVLPLLPKRKVHPQHGKSSIRKYRSDGLEQSGLAIATRTVSEHERVSIRLLRRMQEPANGRIAVAIGKLLNAGRL
jgi:hypothetical protein